MSLLYRVIYATHANGSHHKLALDSLQRLTRHDADAWQRLFLKHVELYLDGSKAPDKQFKDFKNHVLHVRDKFWGGAPEKVESWYAHLVTALRDRNWPEAAWCAGVLSHYYGREAGLELREDIDTVLEPGMVISMEPMLTIPEGQPGAGGYREHDILVITEDGNEDITKYPYGPEFNTVG